jgi:hypothetical protein
MSTGPLNSSAPTTSFVIGGVYNVTSPAPLPGQALPLQIDANGNILVNIAAGSSSGTQYVDGTTQATPTGTVALGKNPSNVLHSLALDASGNLNVNIAAGSSSGVQFADNAASGATPTGTLSMGWDSVNSKIRALKVDASQDLFVAFSSAQAVTLTSTTITGTVAVTQSTSPWVENVSQFAGNPVLTGTGLSGVGVPRVTVSSDSFPATQAVSGTVIANQGTITDTSPATFTFTAVDVASTSVTGFTGQLLWSGTPTAGSSATFALSSGFDTVVVQVTGPGSPLLVSEVSLDGGTTWVSVPMMVPSSQGLPYNTGIAAMGGPFSGVINVSGYTHVRIRVTGGNFGAGNPVCKIVQTVNKGIINVVGSMVLQDRTSQNHLSTIKNGFTAPAGVDTALVVAISPNNFGQATSVNSFPVVIASDQVPLLLPVNAAQETGGNLVTIANQTRNDAQIVDLLVQILSQAKYQNMLLASSSTADMDDVDTISSTLVQ